MKRFEEIDAIIEKCNNTEEVFLLNELTVRRNLDENKNLIKTHKLAYGNIKENGQIKKLVAIYCPNEIDEDAAEDICLENDIKNAQVIVLPKVSEIIGKFK